MIKLRDLFDAKDLTPAAMDREAAGLCVDSRKAKKGDVFFAVAGVKTDGGKFAVDAAARGETS